MSKQLKRLERSSRSPLQDKTCDELITAFYAQKLHLKFGEFLDEYEQVLLRKEREDEEVSTD